LWSAKNSRARMEKDYFDSHFGWVLIHILGMFWFTFRVSFESPFGWIFIHTLDEFWFTFWMSFDSHFEWILIHILSEFWFTFWVSLDSHFGYVLIQILGHLVKIDKLSTAWYIRVLTNRWNIVEIGIKHHQTKQTNCISLVI
jgi:hypothetical protein